MIRSSGTVLVMCRYKDHNQRTMVLLPVFAAGVTVLLMSALN